MPYFGPTAGSLSQYDYKAPKKQEHHSLLHNMFQDVQDFATGFGPGLLHIGGALSHDVGKGLGLVHGSFQSDDIAKAILADYKHVYGPAFSGNLGLTAHRIHEHPLGPVLDALAIISGGGAALGKIGKTVAKSGQFDLATRTKWASIAGMDHLGHIGELEHTQGYLHHIVPKKLTHEGRFEHDPAYKSGDQLSTEIERQPEHSGLHTDEQLAKIGDSLGHTLHADDGHVFVRRVSHIGREGSQLKIPHHQNPYHRGKSIGFAKLGAKVDEVPVAGAIIGTTKREARQAKIRILAHQIKQAKSHVPPKLLGLIGGAMEREDHNQLLQNSIAAMEEGVSIGDQIAGHKGIIQTGEHGLKHRAALKKMRTDVAKIHANPSERIQYHIDEATSLRERADQLAQQTDEAHAKIRKSKITKPKLIELIHEDNKKLENLTRKRGKNKGQAYHRRVETRDLAKLTREQLIERRVAQLKRLNPEAYAGKGRIEHMLAEHDRHIVYAHMATDTANARNARLAHLEKHEGKAEHEMPGLPEDALDHDLPKRVLARIEEHLSRGEHLDLLKPAIEKRVGEELGDPKLRAVEAMLKVHRGEELTPEQLHEALGSLSDADHEVVLSFIHAGGLDKIRELFQAHSRLESEGTTRNYREINEMRAKAEGKDAPSGEEIMGPNGQPIRDAEGKVVTGEQRRAGTQVAFDRAADQGKHGLIDSFFDAERKGRENFSTYDPESLQAAYEKQIHYLESLGFEHHAEGERVHPVIRSHQSKPDEATIRKQVYEGGATRKVAHQTEFTNVVNALDWWDPKRAVALYQRSLAVHTAMRMLTAAMDRGKWVPTREANEILAKDRFWTPFKVEGQSHLQTQMEELHSFLTTDRKALFGDLGDSPEIERMAEQLEEYMSSREGQVLLVPKAVQQTLFPEIVRANTFIRKFWDNPSRWWRNFTLGLRPAWVVNNLIGNMMLLWSSQGMIKGSRALVQLLWDSKMREGKLTDLIHEYAGSIENSGFSKSMIAEGLAGEGVKADESTGHASMQLMRHLNPNTLAEKVITKNSELLEDPIRRAAFWAEIRLPARRLVKSGAAPDIESAAKMLLQDDEVVHNLTTSVLGDMVNFRDLSEVERTWIRRVVPFYSWIAGISRHTGKLVSEKPAQAAVIADIGRRGHENVQEDFGDAPEFFNSMMGLGHAHGGVRRALNTQSMNPYSTVGDVAGMIQPFVPGAGGGGLQGTQNPLNSINPLAKATLEVGTGKDLFFGGPLNELHKPAEDWRLPGHHAPSTFAHPQDPNMNKAILWLRRYALQYPQVRMAEKATRPDSTHPLFNDSPWTQAGGYFGVPVRSVNLDEAHARAKLEEQ